MPGTRKVHVKTFGCQMNVYDSERIAEALAPYGYAQTDEPSEADILVLNTCHIREKAAEKVYSDLGRIRQIKDERKSAGKNTVVAVAGCVAQAEGQEITRRAPVVDLVIGPQSYHRLPELVFRIEAESRRIVETAFPEEDKFDKLPDRERAQEQLEIAAKAAHMTRERLPQGNGTQASISPASRLVSRDKARTAFLTVQEGCDKFCTFCVVPYTRGMEYSRAVEKLALEAQQLVARGVREITLLGQNVNAYHGEGPDGREWSLARLIDHLADIDGIERIRYTTSHPRDMSEDLIAAHRDQPKLMPYLHLPFQAGADRILAAMNRKHTIAEYRELIARIRQARPDIALSTDIIVGFPGETDAEFEETLELVREIEFAQAFSFKYSARPGTPAAKIEDQVAEDVKTERLHTLQALLAEQQGRFNASCVGKTIPVLLEKQGRRDGQLVGRSPYLQPVHVDGAPAHLGEILPVRISSAGQNSLSGSILAA